MNTDLFNPSPNVEDRREELDPIKQFLIDIGLGLGSDTTAKFSEGPGYDIDTYLRDNPTNTPLAQGKLAEDAGAGDIQAYKMQRDREREAAIDARLQRYRDLLSGKKIEEQTQPDFRKTDLREMRDPIPRVNPLDPSDPRAPRDPLPPLRRKFPSP